MFLPLSDCRKESIRFEKQDARVINLIPFSVQVFKDKTKTKTQKWLGHGRSSRHGSKFKQANEQNNNKVNAKKCLWVL